MSDHNLIISKEMMKRFASEIMTNRGEIQINRKVMTDEILPVIREIAPQIISAFKADLSETMRLGEENAKLQFQLEKVQKEKTELAQQVSLLQGRADCSQQEIDKLRADNKKLVDQLEKKEKELEDLEGKLEEAVVTEDEVDGWFQEEIAEEEEDEEEEEEE